jgi:hypothetical protein
VVPDLAPIKEALSARAFRKPTKLLILLALQQREAAAAWDVHTNTQPPGVAGMRTLVHTPEVDRAESQVHLAGEPSR